VVVERIILLPVLAIPLAMYCCIVTSGKTHHAVLSLVTKYTLYGSPFFSHNFKIYLVPVFRTGIHN
jgi:hypothetical protein